MNIPDPPIDPAIPLQELCHKIASFRRYLLERRSNLPRPGYHIDLDVSKAMETTVFLRLVPDLCHQVIESIREFHQSGGGDHFAIALERLKKLRQDPGLVFSQGGRKLHKDLGISEELFAAIVKDPQEIQPVQKDGGQE